jgi:hypothetical protein
VKARTDDNKWFTGFVIGARGEIVFGVDGAPTADLTVITDDGRERPARLLGFDRGLSLAVAIVAGLSEVPLRSARPVRLRPETWVVILGHDAKGRAEPHAGVVAMGPTRGKGGLVYAIAEVPGEPGCPVLTGSGDLAAIAIRRGKRRVRIVPLDHVAPFLERVVLGVDRR